MQTCSETRFSETTGPCCLTESGLSQVSSFLETIFSETGQYAGAGRLNVITVGVAGFAAAVTGDNIGFAIGHYGGRALVLRGGRYVRLTPQRLDQAEGFYRRHGGWIITIARFVEVLRQANGIVAGTTGLRWRRFLAFNALGAALWAGTWVSLGYLAGAHIGTIYHDLTQYSTALLIALAVLLAGYLGWHPWRRRRRAIPPQAPACAPEGQAGRGHHNAEDHERDGLAGGPAVGGAKEQRKQGDRPR